MNKSYSLLLSITVEVDIIADERQDCCRPSYVVVAAAAVVTVTVVVVVAAGYTQGQPWLWPD